MLETGEPQSLCGVSVLPAHPWLATTPPGLRVTGPAQPRPSPACGHPTHRARPSPRTAAPISARRHRPSRTRRAAPAHFGPSRTLRGDPALRMRPANPEATQRAGAAASKARGRLRGARPAQGVRAWWGGRGRTNGARFGDRRPALPGESRARRAAVRAYARARGDLESAAPLGGGREWNSPAGGRGGAEDCGRRMREGRGASVGDARAGGGDCGRRVRKGRAVRASGREIIVGGARARVV